VADLVWRRSGQRIELRWPGDRIEPLVVTLQVTLAYSAEQRVRWQRDDRNLPRYLEPRTGFVRVTPAIQELSRRLVHPDAPASDAIRVFWDYLGDRVRIGLAHHCQLLGTQPGQVVLDHGWADCVLSSSLLVSLCRAHGLPARVVHGRLLYKQAPAPHAWAEVWIPDHGWVPFDLMAWNLAGDDDERGRWSDRFFGKLEPRIVHEVPPNHSPGVVGAPLMRRWIAYATRDLEGGVETRVMDLDGTITFRESYQVEWR
jgi:hypothetical protein